MTFYGLVVVSGAIVFRSLQIVHGEAYDWGALQAFNLSPQWLNALPIVVFGFQVRYRHSKVLGAWVATQLQRDARLFAELRVQSVVVHVVPYQRGGCVCGARAGACALPLI